MSRQAFIAVALTCASLGFSAAIQAEGPATMPATAPAVTDFGNTQCMVMPGDEVGKATFEYKGVTYHFCCKDCVADFKKDPEKYIKAADANPAKYGIKK